MGYPSGSAAAKARETPPKTRPVFVANGGACRGPRLVHHINIPQPDKDGKIKCHGQTLTVGKTESVHIDTLRLMFRAHYREPALTLPTPPPGREQSYRLFYSPARGQWQVEPLKQSKTSTAEVTAASASATAASTSK